VDIRNKSSDPIPQIYDAGNSSEDNDTEIASRSKMNPEIRMTTILPDTEYIRHLQHPGPCKCFQIEGMIFFRVGVTLGNCL
jgi:hypothetical protein